ncbi:MAG TPA: flagellar biosynthetic protein FliO [Blastocatellia bacterium]|nr:flagellar biosynthetic protein FliO [Blastocatellia bacterium]
MNQRRRRISCLLLLALVSLAGFARVAAQPEPAAPPAPPAAAPTPADDPERIPFMARPKTEIGVEAPSAAGLLARTLGALLLIVGLIVAAAWILRRFGGAKFGRPPEGVPELAVLATVPLGDRRSLAAVRFGDRLLLIGMTAQAITLLASTERRAARTAPPSRSVADLLMEAQKGQAPSFEESLAEAVRRHGGAAR